MKRFEIWASFKDGLTVRVESHKTMKAAQAAVDAMNNHNKNDLAVGCGFPRGVPAYTIK